MVTPIQLRHILDIAITGMAIFLQYASLTYFNSEYETYKNKVDIIYFMEKAMAVILFCVVGRR